MRAGHRRVETTRSRRLEFLYGISHPLQKDKLVPSTRGRSKGRRLWESSMVPSASLARSSPPRPITKRQRRYEKQRCASGGDELAASSIALPSLPLTSATCQMHDAGDVMQRNAGTAGRMQDEDCHLEVVHERQCTTAVKSCSAALLENSGMASAVVCEWKRAKPPLGSVAEMPCRGGGTRFPCWCIASKVR